MISRWTGRLRAWLAGGSLLPSAPKTSAALGKSGERAAARRLSRLGYRIIERNYRSGGVEIDLIALDRGCVVFVEVKTRRTRSKGSATEAVDSRKRERMRRAAAMFVAARGMEATPIRFDVVAIHDEGGRRQLEIIRDAF